MYSDEFIFDGPFDGEWYQFHTTTNDNENWVATQGGSSRILTVPFTEYTYLGLLVLNRANADAMTYRIIQWLNTSWLKTLIEEREDVNMNTFVFNFSRGDSDRRCFINFHHNDFTKLTFSRASSTSNDSDVYWLVCFGMR